MVSSEAHAAIEQVRQRHRATHARVVEALISCVTTESIDAAMERLQVRRRIDRKAREQRRREIERLIGTLGDEAFNRLVGMLKYPGEQQSGS